MSDHPTTFQGEPSDVGTGHWDDHASIHRRQAGEHSDMLRGFNVMRDGTFAEMIRFVMSMPADKREGLVIQKSGDRVYSLGEIRSLAARDDFPKA